MPSRSVLVLFEYATLNGGERSFLAAAPQLLACGFDLTAVVFEEGPLRSELQAAAVEVQVLPSAAESTQQSKRENLARFLQTHRPSLLHANSLSMTRLSAPVANALRIPHLGHLRDIARLSKQAIFDLSQSDRLLAVSQSVRHAFEFQGAPCGRLFVLPNGVDLRVFSPGERLGPLRKELGIGDRPMVVGIGQLSLRKGFDVWLAAAERIARKAPECQFVIVGEQHSQKAETTAYVNELRIRSASEILSGRVHWLGRRDDVAGILQEADLLMHAARQEPLGRVLLEALAVGLPMIATDVGGTAEILPAAEHEAALVTVDDPEALATAALALLDSPSRRAEIRESYRIWAAANFSAERAGAGLVEHYRSVCEGAADRSD